MPARQSSREAKRSPRRPRPLPPRIRACAARAAEGEPPGGVTAGAILAGATGARGGQALDWPRCGERETRVIDSRDLDEASIRRRRECETCGARFTTYERIEAPRLSVVKRDGSRQDFDRERLLSGFRKALTRRPLPDDAAEQAADQIEAQLRSGGVTEVDSSEIGKLAMDKLRTLDQIAYIRFASVYQSFEDLETLKREVDNLYSQRESGAAVK